MVQKDICTRVLTAALFTVAKTWEQPKCPSSGEWIKEMWYIYTMEYYLAIKKNPICNIDGPRDCLGVSQTKTNIVYIAYMWNIKKNPIQMNLFIEQK